MKKTNIITMDEAINILSDRYWKQDITEERYNTLAGKVFEIHRETEKHLQSQLLKK